MGAEEALGADRPAEVASEADHPAEVAAVEEEAGAGAGARRAHPTSLLVRDNTCVNVLVSSSVWSELTSVLSLTGWL